MSVPGWLSHRPVVRVTNSWIGCNLYLHSVQVNYVSNSHISIFRGKSEWNTQALERLWGRWGTCQDLCDTISHFVLIAAVGKLLKTGWNTRQQDHWLLVLILIQLPWHQMMSDCSCLHLFCLYFHTCVGGGYMWKMADTVVAVKGLCWQISWGDSWKLIVSRGFIAKITGAGPCPVCP